MAPARTAPIYRPLTAIFALALALRLAMVPFAGVYHPDELFQYLEQAHRLVFGQGIVPWEYRYGMRSWALPLTLVPPMALGGALAPGSTAYLLLPRACAACASLSIVWSANVFGARISRRHGLIAASIAAIWSEFVYLAPHILSETASIALILPAAALLTGKAGPRALFAAGAMLGLALVFRIQHAPAIAALLLLALWQRIAEWRPVALGLLAALMLGAIVDLAMGQAPYGWAIAYVRQNFGPHAQIFGTEPAMAYVHAMVAAYGWWAAPMAVLAGLGARRCPLLLGVALVNLALHMAIPHKEYRFILLTTAILALLAAIGTGDAIEAVAARWNLRLPIATGAALLLWALASASLAAEGRVSQFVQPGGDGPRLYAEIGRDPSLCGLATLDSHFSTGGGYTYLHRAVPIYAYDGDQAAHAQRESEGFNRLIAPMNAAPLPGFARAGCSAGDAPLCILARPGGCRVTGSTAEINRQLILRNE